ncbi:hypothetical protein PGT21_021262 [Puccinia graminis f. sp. tritici]|uniref:DUF6589 domain-containing protein n=1 Tax=Puccinia graminis f. sp. tritici TaxID=56615 RepID=A0A5B0N6T7_PUCGR|nr:hypothetical protein PGT21_021262 [Puccinia graminis f. sp. tritici]
MKRRPFKPQFKTTYQKIRFVCDIISRFNMTPKKFILAFLTNQHIDLALRSGCWGTKTGWTTTLELIQAIKRLATKSKASRCLWREFILQEAKTFVNSESPKRGVFPNGAYHNSQTVHEKFFARQSKDNRDSKLVTEDMPFLYELISSKLLNRIKKKPQESSNNDSEDDESTSIDSEDSDVDLALNTEDALTVEPGRNHIRKVSKNRQETRAHMTAKTVCAMVSFGENRRANSMQLYNSVVFLACGVTERINSYLHYIGLTMLRKTALSALDRLGHQAKKRIAQKLSVSARKHLSPLLCIDNIDFEERVHFKSVETTSHMFHGTWGYVHTLDPSLILKADPEEFSMNQFQKAIKDSVNLKISPTMFLPTFEEESHFCNAIKSQIAQVMMSYIATTYDPKSSIPLEPPSIDQIRAQNPDIKMFELMLASDNCAEGIGEILTDIIKQTNLTPDEFFSELQIMDGDLGTLQNMECLRGQRKPSGYKEDSLGNIFMLLGASHTLWNIAQAIYLKHFGNNKIQDDLGSWRTLQALGLPSEKPAAKNDFTLMLTSIQKIHEVTLIHCLLLPNEKIKLKAKSINHIINLCYDRFFGCTQLKKAKTFNSPKLFNLMTRLRDFATIVEADRLMKAGDIG